MKYLLAGFLSLALVGCGGSDDDPPMVAAADTAVSVTAATAGAVRNTPFVFSSGVPALGTSGSTTVAFADTSATPAFSISADGATATGTTTFGSCIFTVMSSSFPAGHPLAAGQTVTVNPCGLNVSTAGTAANGVPTNRNVALLLGAASSAGASVTIQVNADGRLILNGAAVGMVTLTPVTGS